MPAGTTVVTVGHIPLRSGALALGYAAEGLARSLLSVAGRASYPHVVRNADALVEILRPYRWTLALQGHTHMTEKLPADAGAADPVSHRPRRRRAKARGNAAPDSSSTESTAARSTTASSCSWTPALRARASSSSGRSRTTSSRAAPR